MATAHANERPSDREMINIAFRLLLTFNATSLLVIVFLVQKGLTLKCVFESKPWLVQLPNVVSYVVYFCVPVLLTGLSILLSSRLGKDEFKKGTIQSIEHANNSFLPSYFGYFFVALSVGNWETLWFVYGVLFLFTFLSQALYFNPLFLIFRYEFYNIKTNSGTAIFLISRQQYKKPDEIDISVAYRINDYTFIERN
ncbi:hypothetical protein RGU72_12980 [Undibacterium sp. 5I1]|uniref:hypothetical protein n=1 Tax=unclassified Undibacterium TaxID=2630295 RepID=UPI002AB40A41|nr:MULTISPECIES: hypothetical protein [unclassified Undibacterium]MDY7539167.1 hypothetical protein [Undibacterium sp. 5I1]MEB0232405.1 hypothetical protein [Undibacterium sp. 10I3]MEB0257035.1 hypothetical protein [Undibacterium sp. 5I1]